MCGGVKRTGCQAKEKNDTEIRAQGRVDLKNKIRRGRQKDELRENAKQKATIRNSSL